jgi:hypothetical protein
MRRLWTFKGAIEGGWVASFETLCRQWFAAFAVRAADQREVAAYPIVARFGRQSGIPLSPALFEQTKPPAGIEEFFDVITRMPMWERLTDRGDLYLLRDYCSIRRQRPDETGTALGWHQDSAVVTGLIRARGVRGYVLWVPVTAIDGDTPTLQVMPSWLWPLKHYGTQYGYLESIRKPWGRTVTLEQMQQGDVALFDINCPHRTYVRPGMHKERLSVDLRVVRTVPQGYRGEAIQLPLRA